MIRKPFIIAETAYNHQGDLNYLMRMIDEIAEMGLHAIKFHLLLNQQSYFQESHPMLSSVADWMFSESQWREILDRSASYDLKIVALCDDVDSLCFIKQNYPDLFAIELHATSINDYFMLQESVEFKGRLMLGIGGSTIEEIKFALDFWGDENRDRIILMHGFQNYPTNYNDINMSKMLLIRDLFKVEVGYADHTSYDDPDNEIISCLAAAMGFSILEKHYTLDPGIERLDFHAAVGKKQMQRIKALAEKTLSAFGDENLKMSQAELEYGNIGPMKKAIVAREFIPKGSKLSEDNLWLKRTNQSATLSQREIMSLFGKKAIRNINPDEIIDYSNVEYQFEKYDLSDFTHTKKNK